jgi:hypothetical protein
MTPELDYGMEEGKTEGLGLIDGDHYDEDEDDDESAGTIHAVDDITRQLEEEAELERKVEALERMRGRRGSSAFYFFLIRVSEIQLTCQDLEEVIGTPFPVSFTLYSKISAQC